MSTPDTASLERVIAQAAEREPDVLAAYLFGSRARGEEHGRSDLDVGVLEAPGHSLGLDAEDRLRCFIAEATGLSVDLALMRWSSPVLAFEVLRDGRRVFARDEERADEIEQRLHLHYLDTAHLRKVQREYFFGGNS
jgi:predicted nucleotidyltransferase